MRREKVSYKRSVRADRHQRLAASDQPDDEERIIKIRERTILVQRRENLVKRYSHPQIHVGRGVVLSPLYVFVVGLSRMYFKVGLPIRE